MGGTLSNLERGAHLIGHHLHPLVRELGITQAEANVLAQVAAAGPTPIATLHREFGHKRSTLTNVVDRLERHGFVRREVNRDDRRSFIVRLTPAGRAAARRVTRALEALEGELAALVTKGDLRAVEVVVRSLEQVAQRASRH